MTFPPLAATSGPARAQETLPTEQPMPEPEQPPSSVPQLGLIDELGKLLKKPAALLPSLQKSEPPPDPPKPEIVPAPAPAVQAQPAPPAEAAPPAAEAPAPPTRFFPGMVSGREVCPRSANGAPDCQAGTDNLCKSKGYRSGKSLNIDSAFGCSKRQARAEGRKPCGTEHFVTTAFCQ